MTSPTECPQARVGAGPLSRILIVSLGEFEGLSWTHASPTTQPGAVRSREPARRLPRAGRPHDREGAGVRDDADAVDDADSPVVRRSHMDLHVACRSGMSTPFRQAGCLGDQLAEHQLYSVAWSAEVSPLQLDLRSRSAASR